MLNWRIFLVVGASMSPTLSNGDYVLAKKNKTRPVVGAIVIIPHLEFGEIIKRVSQVEDSGTAWVSGDNPASTSSRIIGKVDKDNFTYIAHWRISPIGLFKI